MDHTFTRRSFLRSSAAAAAALACPGLPAGAAASQPGQQPLSPLRPTRYGPVRGLQQQGLLCWYGIPYGAAPVGESRWAAPGEPACWQTVRDCTSPAPLACQYAGVPLGTEDCLTLDICASPEARSLPVLVCLHSSFAAGSGSEMPGAALAAGAGCVVVSLSYRLGLFGWNCLPALLQGADASGNFALLDIARALDWVAENISGFGGNPQNITLWGFGDGGRMVAALAASPLSRGRFCRGVALSGGVSAAQPQEAACRLAELFAPLAVEDGLFQDAPSAARWLLTPAPAVRSWLLGLEPGRVAALSGPPAAFPVLYADGVTLPLPGQASPSLPLLLLSSATELSTLLSPASGSFSPAARAYAVRYGSDLCRWGSTAAIAQARAPGSGPVWLGLIDYGGASSLTPLPGLGSFHGMAVALLCPQSSYARWADLSSAGARALSARLMEALAAFLAQGDPGWAPWTAQSPAALRFDADSQSCTASPCLYTDTLQSIRAAMAADTTLSAPEKAAVEQQYLAPLRA